jgi:hypothetical protein
MKPGTNRMERYPLVRSKLKLLKLGAINLLVLFVLLEILSLGFYFLKTRHFFYPRDKEKIKATTSQFEISEPGREEWTLDYQLHPYFGFITPPTYAGLPLKKTGKNQFIIGIFGGSVAKNVYNYEVKHHVLAKALQPLPQFQNKEIVILKFANPAHKQPQQLLTLNYYLSVGQELDMVINIDGFNEVALSYLNNQAGIEVSMPNGIIVAPLIALANKDLSAENLALSLEVLQLKNKLQNTLNRLNECRIATCYTLRWVQAKYLFNQYRGKSQTLSQLKREEGKDSLIYLKRVEKPLDDAEVFERTLDVWSNSSLAMNDLLTARKIPYFEFIQPNQYYPTNRQFSADEKKVAFDENSPFKEGTIKGYPKLLAKLSSLRNAGVSIFNAVNVFDETRDIMYVDNCCHYTDAGNEVFSRYIGQSIVTALNTKPASK